MHAIGIDIGGTGIKGAVVDVELEPASKDQVSAFIKTQLPKIDHVIDYLKDK